MGDRQSMTLLTRGVAMSIRAALPTLHEQSVLSVYQRWLRARPRPDRQEPQPHVPSRCRIGGARLVSIRRSTHGYARFNGRWGPRAQPVSLLVGSKQPQAPTAPSEPPQTEHRPVSTEPPEPPIRHPHRPMAAWRMEEVANAAEYVPPTGRRRDSLDDPPRWGTSRRPTLPGPLRVAVRVRSSVLHAS
jgi:hypothetical protein